MSPILSYCQSASAQVLLFFGGNSVPLSHMDTVPDTEPWRTKKWHLAPTLPYIRGVGGVEVAAQGRDLHFHPLPKNDGIPASSHFIPVPCLSHFHV